MNPLLIVWAAYGAFSLMCAATCWAAILMLPEMEAEEEETNRVPDNDEKMRAALRD